MRLAVVAAGFTPGEADQLRRAMAAWRRPGVIDQFRRKLLEGMAQRGLEGAFAEQVFRQIRGFGEYGFPESHAASFALLVYASCYLKCHYPAAFCAAVLNSQPMGFYAPAQLVEDARRHGVEVRGAEINASQWDCTLEESADARRPALRLGLRMIRGLAEHEARKIVEVRESSGGYRSISDVKHRAGIGQGTLSLLADADALASLTLDRRAALWETLGQERSGASMPLLERIDEHERDPGIDLLRPITPLEEVHGDYEATGLSLRGHPIEFCRAELESIGCIRASEIPTLRSGRSICVAGLVLMRQRPGTAKGITFVTIEDETGSMNLILHPATWGRYLTICRTSNAWIVDGRLDHRSGVIHVIVNRLRDLSPTLRGLESKSRDFH